MGSSENEKKAGKFKRRIMPTGPGTKRNKDDAEMEDVQHLTDEIKVSVGDKVRVFYHSYETIYEAKVKRIQDQKPWPRYFVHYQGWNARYDEWIKRSRIKENLSWSKDRVIDSTELEQVDEPVVPERKKPGPKVGRTPSKKALV